MTDRVLVASASASCYFVRFSFCWLLAKERTIAMQKLVSYQYAPS